MVIIGTRKLSIPLDIWKDLGSPVYMIKERHLPTGELHLVPSSEQDPISRTVDFLMSPPTRKRVRLSLSAYETLATIPGKYPAEVAVVLGRPVVIIKGALK